MRGLGVKRVARVLCPSFCLLCPREEQSAGSLSTRISQDSQNSHRAARPSMMRAVRAMVVVIRCVQ